MARWPFAISATSLPVFAAGAGDEYLEARVALGSCSPRGPRSRRGPSRRGYDPSPWPAPRRRRPTFWHARKLQARGRRQVAQQLASSLRRDVTHGRKH
eukprot:8877811-Heterocapsa_arctica.AAC.1